MLEEVFACLPDALRAEIHRMAEGYAHFDARLYEIRLRAGRHAALTLDGHNLLLTTCLTQDAVRATLERLCGGSVYVYGESLRQGYLTVHGCRVGVAGRAVCEGGRVVGLADASSLCIRIPHRIEGAGRVAEQVFRALPARGGLLIYAPPGCGKTTLLRDLARRLSCGRDALRLALVDTRGELGEPPPPPDCQWDILRDYPLPVGIEIATRTLAPEVIVCDEIGSPEDAAAILQVQGCGIPLIASAHAGSYAELISRPPFRLLDEGGVFAAYLGICRLQDTYTYTVAWRTGCPAACVEV